MSEYIVVELCPESQYLGKYLDCEVDRVTDATRTTKGDVVIGEVIVDGHIKGIINESDLKKVKVNVKQKFNFKEFCKKL